MGFCFHKLYFHASLWSGKPYRFILWKRFRESAPKDLPGDGLQWNDKDTRWLEMRRAHRWYTQGWWEAQGRDQEQEEEQHGQCSFVFRGNPGAGTIHNGCLKNPHPREELHCLVLHHRPATAYRWLMPLRQNQVPCHFFLCNTYWETQSKHKQISRCRLLCAAQGKQSAHYFSPVRSWTSAPQLCIQRQHLAQLEKWACLFLVFWRISSQTNHFSHKPTHKFLGCYLSHPKYAK